MSTIRNALEFYRGEAIALARYMAEGKENKANAILASVTVLSLDAGKRADAALSVDVEGAMTPSQAIIFLASIKRSEHDDVFEALVILAKTIVREGVQYDIDNDFETD